jgi:hypothetical protein
MTEWGRDEGEPGVIVGTYKDGNVATMKILDVSCHIGNLFMAEIMAMGQ